MRFVLCLTMALGLSAAHVAHATAADKRNVTLNANAVGLLASQPSAMQEGIAISGAVTHVESLRVLPIAGNGSLQSLNDLLFLHGVDVAILSSDSLGYARKHKLYSDEDTKLAYLAKLANSSVVILTRTDTASLRDLAGRKVATGPATSDSFLAADLIFGDQQINVDRLALHGSAAVKALRDGTVDAAVLVTAESNTTLASIKLDNGLKVLPVSVSAALAEVYAPSIIDAAQYPGLVSEGAVIETVASAVILAVFDWPKNSKNADKLRKFDKALFEYYLSGLSADRVTNFSAAVPGWKPFGATNQSSQSLPVGVPGTLVAYNP